VFTSAYPSADVGLNNFPCDAFTGDEILILPWTRLHLGEDENL